MIKKIEYIIGNSLNPYENLALEEYLLDIVDENTCILYLWQNAHTIVIGKNQNPWKECRVSEFEASGGNLVRRLSGGGAVYHDMGNLNFTFLVNKNNYDLHKQLSVIIKALEYLGIEATFSGRNDIIVDDKKFSGNAFYTKGENSYHHGTILVDVDMQSLSKYLNVSKEKLSSKGVDSVKSRVTNLKPYRQELTIDLMKEKLIEAFSEVYELDVKEIKEDDLDKKRRKDLEEKFSSWDWKFGRKIPFEYSIDRRFLWGNLDINFQVDKGIIKDCLIYSDAMEVNLLEEIPRKLVNCEYNREKIIGIVDKAKNNFDELEYMIDDIISLLEEI